MTTAGSARSLLRDQRGGVEFLAYLMLVALIAFVALAGVRGYDGSVRDSFADSTTRFDRPGTYWGGSVDELPTGDRGGPPPIPTFARAPGSGPAAGDEAPAAPSATAELHAWEPRWHETPWIAGLMNGTGASIPIAIAGIFSESAARVSSNLEHYGQHRNLHNQLTGAYYAEGAAMVGGGLTSVVRRGLARITGQAAGQASRGGWLARRVRHRETTTLTNAHPQIVAADVLGEYAPGTGFSGAYNPETGSFVALASDGARLSNGQVAPNTVPRRGGHYYAEQALMERVTSTDASRNVGFTLILQEDGKLRVNWTSGQINSRNFPGVGDRLPPADVRPPIIEAIEAATGREVVQQ